jgi:GntR family transcriptional regulator, transcriptional repressor for pyruvate dehydrogenase complex
MVGRTAGVEKVSETVARKIIQSIIETELEPGSKLPPEHEMLALYKVSRPSLREALRLLEIQGIIRLRSGPGGGPVVEAESSRAFARLMGMHLYYAGARIRDLMEARFVIEPLMARLAATASDETARKLLEVSLMEEQASTTGDSGEPNIEAAMRFHDRICEMSGNPVLDRLAGGLKALYQDRTRSLRFPKETQLHVLEDHRAIAAAILAGEGDEAEHLMRVHMREFADFCYVQVAGLVDEVVTWEWSFNTQEFVVVRQPVVIIRLVSDVRSIGYYDDRMEWRLETYGVKV